MEEMQFTTVDRVLAKFHRDFRGTNINESDAIEWIGEALGFLKVQQIQEEAVAFLEVKNYETIVPAYFNMVIQVARKKHWTKDTSCELTPEKVIEMKCCCEPKKECNCKGTSSDLDCSCGVGCSGCDNDCTCKSKTAVYTDCQGNIIGDHEQVYYRPYFDLQWEYNLWRDHIFYQKEFTPVKLSNNTFFHSVVCKEYDRELYRNCADEYTIVGTTQKKLRFSFKDGLVALSYLRTAIDQESGYPLVPDNESYLAAITYYIKWKIAEWYQWNGREGFQGPLVSDLERKWLKYCRQAKNYAKMPKSLDDHQALMEQTYSLPNLYKYYNFFGNCGIGFGNKTFLWLK